MLKLYKVFGQSMFPTLKEGEYILSESLSYKLINPAINDVVIFKSPRENFKLIKRITEITGGKYFVKGIIKISARTAESLALLTVRILSEKQLCYSSI